MFTENKQLMIHIASEVVVLVGITFYFNQKNKKLTAHLEDLVQRVEEQEDLLQKHEQMIKQLTEYVSQHHLQMQQNRTNTHRAPTKIHKSKPMLRSPPIKKKHSNEKPRTPVRVSFSDPEVPQTLESVVDESEKSESDEELEEELDEKLDEELEEELNDLNEDSVDLKKSL